MKMYSTFTAAILKRRCCYPSSSSSSRLQQQQLQYLQQYLQRQQQQPAPVVVVARSLFSTTTRNNKAPTTTLLFPRTTTTNIPNSTTTTTSSSSSNNNNLNRLTTTSTTIRRNKYYHTTSYHCRDYDIKEYDGVSAEISEIIYKHARQPQTSVSLQALMRTGRGEFLHKTFDDISPAEPEEVVDAANGRNGHTATELVLIQVASFLRRELPIRLAHRIQDLEGVPLMKDMPSVKIVKELYIKSLLELAEFDEKIEHPDQEEEFARLVEGIYERHSRVLVQMAKGAYEYRNHVIQQQQQQQQGASLAGKDHFAKMEETHAFLDRFYLCRIGIRVLIGQFLALRQPPVENYVGIICGVTSPYEIVKRAIDDAAFMCTRKYGDAPEVIMSGRLDLTFPYVPTHLHYILLELLKNSMRATVEWHGIDADFPPIKVIIADGNDNEDVVIKVSDEGGGIPRSNVKKIWSYLFTTADPSIQEGMVGVNSNEGVDHGIDSPLAGLGYGLPISRSYCRYFGGDLSIMSMEGYGTDAFVYLARLGNTQEPLPI